MRAQPALEWPRTALPACGPPLGDEGVELVGPTFDLAVPAAERLTAGTEHEGVPGAGAVRDPAFLPDRLGVSPAALTVARIRLGRAASAARGACLARWCVVRRSASPGWMIHEHSSAESSPPVTTRIRAK